jgi:hypothetical protein
MSPARTSWRPLTILAAAVFALPLLAQQHEVSPSDPIAPDAALSTPVPDKYQKKLKKYDMPELVGAQQALGSQLIDGRLRKPMLDFLIVDGVVEQRISLFEQGLAVVKMTGASSIRKKVLLPEDAIAAYVKHVTAPRLAQIDPKSLSMPETTRRAQLRIYVEDGSFVERTFHPASILSQQLTDLVEPLRDLLRAISEDRGVTTAIANYKPRPGDQLVADDHKVWRVARVLEDAGVVELHCQNVPTIMYVTIKDLHLHFLGTKARE